jgi:eukaryotic-like serine/threonine-protein kinase
LIPLCERTVIAGKYRLERELASGGMGAVWVARHLQLDELVAVKFMSATLPALSDARARFAREARSAARLRSPHVVQVLDHGVDEDVPYIVMELLQGEHLGDRLKRERRLHLSAAAAIAAQVGKALGRAHRAGIVHRDLKPANIFLTRLDDEEIVKILDFGIAKTPRAHDEEATSLGVLMGSPQYMSPEQARGSSSLDHRADLWSLGAILFRAVTGVAAFDGASAIDVIVQICTAPIPVASHAAPDLPPRLDAFFLRALARDPARRFASAHEMIEAFADVVRRIAEGDASPSAGAAADPGARDDREDGETFVMDRRAADGPNALRARVVAASSDEIDAFVERAFGALVHASGAGDSVPPTTRCPPGKSSSPPPATLERLAPGSFQDTPEPISPAPSSLFARLTRLDTLRPREPGGSVAGLIEEGFTALRRGEPDSARRAWQEALGLDPSNRLLSLNLRRLDAAPLGRR